MIVQTSRRKKSGKSYKEGRKKNKTEHRKKLKDPLQDGSIIIITITIVVVVVVVMQI